MTDKSDVENEIIDSLGKDDSNCDNDPTPSVSDSVEVKVDLGESESSGDNTVKHNAASGDTALPEPNDSESMDFVAILPPELTDMIFSHLSTNELEFCGSVSQLWSRITNNLIQRRYFVQRTRLKNNWEKGEYCVHHLEISDRMECKPLRNVVLLPSNAPHDSGFYYPLKCIRRDSNLYSFYIMQIDDNLRLKSARVWSNSFIKKVCVMRNCLVWIGEFGTVHFYEGKQAAWSRLKDFNARGQYIDIGDDGFLTMDIHHIVAMSREGVLRVWCKQTYELTLQRERKESTPQLCSLFDGYLIISSGPNTSSDSGNTSKIEIHNLRSVKQNTLQHTFLLTEPLKISIQMDPIFF